VWLAALAGAILVGIFSGEQFLTWIPVVAAGALLLTFVIQLSLQRKEGLVNRMIASIGGVLVILVVATVVLILLHPGSLGRLFS
jgi:zinc transporter ZupT